VPKHPRLTGKELVAALARHGFVVFRVRGSHHVLKHKDGRVSVVPVHGKETIGPGLLSQILRDCELAADDLRSSN